MLDTVDRNHWSLKENRICRSLMLDRSHRSLFAGLKLQGSCRTGTGPHEVFFMQNRNRRSVVRNLENHMAFRTETTGIRNRKFVTHAGREPQDHRTVCCKTGTTSLLLQDRNRRSVYCRTGTTSRYCRTVTASLYSAGQEPQVCYCRAGTAGLYTAGQEPQVRYCRTGSAIMYTAGQETF